MPSPDDFHWIALIAPFLPSYSRRSELHFLLFHSPPSLLALCSGLESRLRFFTALHLALTQDGPFKLSWSQVLVFIGALSTQTSGHSLLMIPRMAPMLLGRSAREQNPQAAITLFLLLLCSPLKFCFSPINKSKCWKSAALM